jgi:hypothetical protein
MIRYRQLWDHAGVAVSTACMVHCIALPVLLVFLPGLAVLVPSAESVHVALIAVLVAVAAAAFVPGYRRHGRRGVLVLAGAGLALVSTGALAHELGEWAETVLTVSGSVVLVAAHVLNRRACPRCDEVAPPAGSAMSQRA